MQSLDDKLLKDVGRIHTREQAINAIKLIKQNNFAFSVDLMCGLPNQTLDSFKQTLNQIISFNPDHVSCYSLILEESTPLFKMVENKEITLPSEEESLEMYTYAQEYLTKNGLNQYEVSNFSLKGKECLHNINYWKCGEYLGFGLNAHSYYNNFRFSNTDNLQKYLKKIKFSKNDVEFCEKIDKKMQKTEILMLGLRMNGGVDLGEYQHKIGENLLITKQDVLLNLQSKYHTLLSNIHEYLIYS